MKVFFVTYGCSYNQEDTEIMKQLLKYEIVNSIEECDIIVVNGCIVKNPTENKIHRFIQDHNDKKIVIAGCYGQVNHEKYKNYTVIGTNTIDKINEAVESAFNDKNKHFISDNKLDKCKLIKANNNIIQIVPIAEGCVGCCSYCAVKFARTNLKSCSIENIIRIIDNALNKGTKEIWLTSQDNGCYGHDINTNIVELLEKILSEFKDKEFFIRLGMMNPNFALEYIDELVEIFKDNHMYKFVHLPVQSGNNRILESMNRKYKVEDFVKVVEKLKTIEDMTIATDIIVGFPTESEKEFNDTYELIKKLRLNIVNISRYWKKKNTKASEMQQINAKDIMKRSKKLHDLMDDISKQNNKHWLNWIGYILVNEKGHNKEDYWGRNIAYKNVLVKNTPIGKKIKVKITKTLGHYLIADVLE